MYCTHCGVQNQAAAHYCGGCGNGINASEHSKSAAARAGVMRSLGERITNWAGTDKLEGFSLSALFSQVYRRRTQEEVDEYFVVGTAGTTPRLHDVNSSWPQPWFFARVLLFVGLVYLGFYFAWEQFANTKLIPGLIMMGSLAVPLATLTLFFELNTPRNVSLNRVLMLVLSGGIVSLFVASIGFTIADPNLAWMGDSAAGIVEEVSKLLAVLIVAGQFRKKRYVLNGLLFGAAVGAGFAFFESCGYALDRYTFTLLKQVIAAKSAGLIVTPGLLDSLLARSADAMFAVVQTRAFLAPFGHVAWTAIAAGALWRALGDQPFQLGALLDSKFLRTFCIPVGLHMIWDLPDGGYVRYLVLGGIGWFVVFGLVQQGLRQIADEQRRLGEGQSVTATATPGPQLVGHAGSPALQSVPMA
jgi:protease PrsW